MTHAAAAKAPLRSNETYARKPCSIVNGDAISGCHSSRGIGPLDRRCAR